MRNIGLIGYTGLIGTTLVQQTEFSHLYSSENIDTMSATEFDIVVCAAPTGNRLWVAQNAESDLANIQSLISNIKNTKIKKFILISTVDTVAYPDTAYSRNRQLLESFVSDNFDDYHIVRLCTLISKDIKKNILFDLRNKLFVDKIDPAAIAQWYPLRNLWADITSVILDNTKDINLVSSPIANSSIAAEFFSDVILTDKLDSKIYNIKPYRYSREQIYTAIREYLE